MANRPFVMAQHAFLQSGLEPRSSSSNYAVLPALAWATSERPFLRTQAKTMASSQGAQTDLKPTNKQSNWLSSVSIRLGLISLYELIQKPLANGANRFASARRGVDGKIVSPEGDFDRK